MLTVTINKRSKWLLNIFPVERIVSALITKHATTLLTNFEDFPLVSEKIQFLFLDIEND